MTTSSILTIMDDELTSIPECDYGYSFTVLKRYSIDPTASDDDLLRTFLTDPAFPTAFGVGVEQRRMEPATHGPYWAAGIKVPDYVRVTAPDVEARVRDWVAGRLHDEPSDSESVVDARLRPVLARGADLFMLRELGNLYQLSSHALSQLVFADPPSPVLSAAASVLDEWLEIVSVDRDAETLTMLAFCGD